MPLLAAENPKIAENLSQMALRLRLDEEFLSQQIDSTALPTVESLKTMPKALRSRHLEAFLKISGVREPEDAHIAMAEALVFSERPSAKASFPGGVTIARNYNRLDVTADTDALEETLLPCPGEIRLDSFRIICSPSEEALDMPDAFTVSPVGAITVRSRLSGDSIRRAGGSKSLKKLFIDRKIPAHRRPYTMVVADERGVLGVGGIGANVDRLATELPAMQIRLEPL
jgi:tRNA(Ile)-lysidine synthase